MINSNAIHSVEIQVKELGMKVEVFDPDGNNIEHTGQPGELVCTRPHPSLPLAFWGDDSGKKLREAYFSMYPGQSSVPSPKCCQQANALQGFGGKVTSWSSILQQTG